MRVLAIVFALSVIFCVGLVAQEHPPQPTVLVAPPPVAPTVDPAARPGAGARKAVENTAGTELTPNVDPSLPLDAPSNAQTSILFKENGSTRSSILSNNSAVVDGDHNNAFKLWHYANGPMVFATNGAERMRIFADGKMAVNATYSGIATGSTRFGIQETIPGVTPFASMLWLVGNYSGAYRAGVLNSYSTGTNTGVLIGGNLTSWSRSGALTQATGAEINAGVCPGCEDGTGSVTNAIGAQIGIYGSATKVTNGYGVWILDVQAGTGYGVYQAGADDKNYFAGNVGIGTAPTSAALQVQGNITASGQITAQTIVGSIYQDFAEWVPAREELAPGTVVVLDPAADNMIRASMSAYDTTVAGVVSAQPGVILGVAGPSKARIATVGRVRVRVDASNVPIRRGDLLVTSDKPGMAMKSVPIEMSGALIHRPGTLIGKALEPLEHGEGEILVLLSLQ
jgi:hypothetical protein